MSEPEKQTTQIPRLGMGYFWDLGLKSKFGTLYSPTDKASPTLSIDFTRWRTLGSVSVLCNKKESFRDLRQIDDKSYY